MHYYIYYIVISIYFFLLNSLLIVFIFNRFIGTKGSQIIICFNSLCSSILSINLFLFFSKNNNFLDINLYSWCSIDLINISIGLLINQLTSSMLCIILIISFFAQLYSIEYMYSDPHKIRYYLYLVLFTLFMVILVTSNNLIQLFLGWEGVGICSFLLINFWYTRFKANKSSLLAVIINKIGDLGLFIAILILQYIYKSLNINFINNSSSYFFESNNYFYNLNYLINIKLDNYDWYDLFIFFDYYNINFYYINILLEFSSICLIIASIGKSAQFGLHIWLPEAMEGPTPVSSLIHAATMVTAGIYLIIRISYIFLHINNILLIIIFIGSITIIIAATIALNQTDIKKIIAYSTCSQLGYMFMSCGFFAFGNSIFHLLMHAFFKALLFLTAGYIIHLFSNNQDIRLLKNLNLMISFGYINLSIGTLTIIGTPFLSGFFSKESIIEFVTLSNFLFVNYYIIVNIVLIISYYTILLTAIYSLKGLIKIFFKRYNGFKYFIYNITFSSFYTIVPLFILSFCSIIFGYLFSEKMIGFQTDFWGNSFFYNNSNYETIQDLRYTNINSILLFEFFEEHKMIASSWTLYIIYVWCVFIYKYINYEYFLDTYYFLTKYSKNNKLKILYIYINIKYIWINRWLFLMIKKQLNSSLIIFFYLFDKGIIEYIGPFGVVNQFLFLLKKYYKLQTGFLYHYLGYIFIGIIVWIYIIYI